MEKRWTMKRHLTLRTKLLWTYLALAIVPILTVATISYFAFVQDTRTIEQELVDYSAGLAAQNISGSTATYRTSIAELVTDPDIISLAGDLQIIGGTARSARAVSELQQRFQSVTYGNSALEGVTFINNNHDSVSCDRRYSGYYNSPRWVSRLYREQVSALCPERGLAILSTADLEEAPSAARDLICMITPVKDWAKGEEYGCIVMEIRADTFTSLLDYSRDSGEGENRMSPLSCIADGSGMIVMALDRGLVGRNISDLDLSAEGITSTQVAHIPKTGLTLHLFFVHATLPRFTRRFFLIMLGMAVLIGTIFFVTVSVITRRIMRRANSLAKALATFGSDVTEVETHAAEDELLSAVDVRFHQMAGQIRELLREQEEQNRRIARESDNRRRSEIKALQSQINPHFLYNALDRINWMAIENDQEEISEMLSGLGSLLRYSISNIDIQVPLRAEMDWMEKYIYIQNKRMDCEILLSCDVEEEAADFPIYKMLLQPLVENAVVHGIEKGMKQLHISLTARYLPGRRLQVILRNDGKPIPPETLLTLREKLSNRGNMEFDGVGVANVVNRMYLYYGEEGQISVESDAKNGTQFTLILPYQTETRENPSEGAQP